jgi:hypothetical protein
VASDRLMLFATAVPRDAAVEAWFARRPGELGVLARSWFARMRECGPDVRELLHDGHPTACVGEAAFCYVNAFTAHVNVGFFLGALLPDPKGLLQGEGRFMRHVKLRPGMPLDQESLASLITESYRDMKARAQRG